MGVNIAIDGPSGAGKSTIARMLSEKMGYVYVNTGELYRAVALFMLRNGVDIQNDAAVEEKLAEVDVKLVFENGDQYVYLCSEKVTEQLRAPDVSMGASRVSAIPAVRSFLFDLQKDLARSNNAIMDGRDIGTVVLPEADVKIFLTASAEERAARRFRELQEMGDPSTYDEVLADINKRDYNDTHRETSPLRKADDAIEIDTTEYDLEQSVQLIYDTVSKALEEKKTAEAYRVRTKRVGIDLGAVAPVTNPGKLSKARIFFYAILRGLVRIYMTIRFKVIFEGVENIPKTGSNIIASNHRSYFDPVFAVIRMKIPCSFMAKDELFHGNKLFAWLIKALGAFPVVRGSGDSGIITASVEKLEKGRNLLIYPEGTRSKTGKLGKGKIGVALIAALAQVPVIPLAVSFKGEKLKKFRQKVIVSFGKPIQPEELKIDLSNMRELKAVKDKIMDSIAEMVNENVNKL